MIKNSPELNTVFDGRIAELEQNVTALASELEELEQGRVKTLLPGGNTYFIDLGQVQESDLAGFLTSRNALVLRLIEAGKKKHELRRELGLEAPVTNREGGLLARQARVNRWVKSKNRLAGLIISSPWLIIAGLVVLVIWAGPLALYQVTGGELGGVTPPRTKTPPTPLWTPVPAAGEGEKSVSLLYLFNYTTVAEDNPGEETTVTRTPSPTIPGTTPVSPTPGNSGNDRVGQLPVAAGGLNGPHGAFLAPARLSVPALKLDTPVQRVLTTEEPVAGNLNLNWPQGKEVAHFGAYPGEVGNMLILGTQESLATLRRLQQNDLVNLYDRDGNLFRYRVLPFSPTGQTERLVDLANAADGWIWNNTAEATLTILVTPPPAPAENSPVDQNQAVGSSSQENTGTTGTHLLAYRAVLALFSPATPAPAGIPVAVPASVWQTSPAVISVTTAPSFTPPGTPPLTATTGQAGTPVPAPAYPGLPDTGDGFCYFNRCGGIYRGLEPRPN